MSTSFTFAVLGAGGRGSGFSHWLKEHPDCGRVVAVADPVPANRQRVADLFAIPPDMQFQNWEDLLARPQLADAVLNTTMDRLHAPSAIAAMGRGYHMLLEKPMAVTLEDCVNIDRVRRQTNRIVSVCHSMRYHVVYAELKRLLDSGAIGELVTFDQLEQVQNIHQSHSFVRWNWGNESRSTFMLMSKSCHDIDIVSYLVGKPCERVSSFGSLQYFRQENAPPGAPLRCTDGCPAEATCEYSVYKIYLASPPIWIDPKTPYEERLRLCKEGPLGRCVFRADNDVVDHQVVSFEYQGGVTGTFTMTAFHHDMGRRIRLHGTRGYIEAHIDNNTIDVRRFLDQRTQRIHFPPQSGGHGGADHNVMLNLVHALRTSDPSAVLTGTAESLRTHRIVFAAELARRTRRVVEMSDFEKLDCLDLPPVTR